jgi:lipopolysaccharide export LptBFGC system permease protein LptF
MKRSGWLISKYLILAVLPYFVFSWLLLSVILFAQQASRFSDIFFNVNIPATMMWQLSVALVPNVVAFTCPMAMLVATVIGLAKMQTDIELVAIRAAGVGNLQITLPIALFGILLSAFAFFVNLEGVPLAAALVRRVALETAIKKLESPIEPGVFNSEVGGYTIFVRDGDVETGRWNNIFIYQGDSAAGIVRLITSKHGRIDFSDQNSELVLEDALVTTLPLEPGAGKYVSENLGETRLAIKTQRSELIERLSRSGGSLGELGLTQLADYASTSEGKDRIEAQILWQRRIILSITPFIFSLLGTGMILRFNRGGRGLGLFLALIGLMGYYILAFVGELFARTGVLPPLVGGLLPIAGSLLAVIWFNYSTRVGILSFATDRIAGIAKKFRTAPDKLQPRNLFVDITTGIRDLDIALNLAKYFLLSLGFLAAVFAIFTAFDLWRSAGAIDGGTALLGTYLFFLLPFMYLQIAPSAAMIATLATYVIKSRQNEIVTWTSAGQSVYRLLMPCFLATAVLGLINWQVQERVLPAANQRQDAIRSQIRNLGKPDDAPGRVWMANEGRIYAFTPMHASDNETQGHDDLSTRNSSAARRNVASDNAKRGCSAGCVKDLNIYELAKGRDDELQSVYRAKLGFWQNGNIVLSGNVETDDLREGKIDTTILDRKELAETVNPFTETHEKPSHLNIAGIKEQIATTDSDLDRRSLSVALQKRYATLFLPLIIALFTAPFALSLDRKGKAATVGYAVGLWLLFTGTSSVFEQFGLNASLSPAFAVWSPLVIFALFGVYLLTKVRT